MLLNWAPGSPPSWPATSRSRGCAASSSSTTPGVSSDQSLNRQHPDMMSANFSDFYERRVATARQWVIFPRPIAGMGYTKVGSPSHLQYADFPGTPVGILWSYLDIGISFLVPLYVFYCHIWNLTPVFRYQKGP